MKSVKCSECGFVGWADSEACKRCGVARTPETIDRSYQPPRARSVNYNTVDRQSLPGEVKKGLAIASLVLGIVNMFTLGLLGLGIIVGVIISIMALTRIRKQPALYGGREFAIAGLVTNLVSILAVVPLALVAAIAIPNVMAARRAANEGSAINALVKIHVAETGYRGRHGSFGTLEELAREGLIAPEIALGQRTGYRFKVETSEADTEHAADFAAVGVPTEYPTSGRRSFFIDNSGVIRAADTHGAEATKMDAPLPRYNDDYPPLRSNRTNRNIGY